MWVYIVGFLVSEMILFQAAQFKTKRHRKMMVLAAMIPLTFISAVRYDVGTDYFYTYQPGFMQIVNGVDGAGSQFEIGFHLLNRLIAIFTSDYRWLFAITSMIFGVLTYLNMERYSESLLLSNFLYMTILVYFASMNAIRQLIAIAIVFSGFRYVQRNELPKYCGVIILACTFHISALILLPIYWIYKIEWNRKFAIKSAIIAIAGSALLAGVLLQVISWVSGGRYAKYLGIDIAGGIWTLLIAIVLFVFALVVNPKDKRIWITVTANLFITAMTWFIPLFSRVTYFSNYALMLFVPSLMLSVPRKLERALVIGAAVLLFSIYVYFAIVVKNGHNVLPYQSIFSAAYL